MVWEVRCIASCALACLLLPLECGAVDVPAMPPASSQMVAAMPTVAPGVGTNAQASASLLQRASIAAPPGQVIEWNANLFSSEAAGGTGEPAIESGILKTRVPFELPASRPGETPALAAHYATNRAGHGDDLGAGWLLAIPTLERHRDAEGDDTYYLRVGTDYTVLLPEADPAGTVLRPRGAPLSATVRLSSDGASAEFADGHSWAFDVSPESSYVIDRLNSVSTWRVTRMSLWGRTYARWSYVLDAGASYLEAISFQPDAGGNYALEARVGYEPRLSPSEWYRGERRVEGRLRVAKLTATAHGALVREWRFAYEPVATLAGVGAIEERLKQIVEVANHPTAGSESARRLASFEYHSTRDLKQETWPSGATPPPPHSALVADLNTDGRADIASTEQGISAWNVWLSKGSAWNVAEPAERPWRPGPAGRVRIGLFGTTVFMPTPWAATAGDFDGDGRTDLLHGLPFQAVGPGVWWMFRGTGTGWKTTGRLEYWREGPLSFSTVPVPPFYDHFSFMLRCRVGRFNMDRRDDVACYHDWQPTGSWTVGYSKGDGWRLAVIGDFKDSLGPAPSAASNAEQKGGTWLKGCVVGDFTGEGLDELACRKSATSLDWDIGLTDGEKWTVATWRVSSTAALGTCLAARVNSDELADLACHGTQGDWYAIASTGSGWAPPRKLAGPNVAAAEGKCSTSDLDGDRISEVVCVDRDPKTFHYASLRADGRVAKLVVSPGNHALFESSCYVADFRGTGAASFICGAANRRETRHAVVSEAFAGLLKTVINAHGGSHHVVYQSSAEVPSQADGGLSPAMPVVASVALFDGSTPVRTDRYSYRGVIKNRRDAFIAFAESRVETLDGTGTLMAASVEHRRRSSESDVDDVLTGTVASRELLSSAGCALRKDSWDYALTPVTGASKPHAYLSQTKSFEPASVERCSEHILVRHSLTHPSEYGLPAAQFEQHSLDGVSEDAVTRFEYLPPTNVGFEPRLKRATLLAGRVQCERTPDGTCAPTAAALADASLQPRGRRLLEYAQNVVSPCTKTPGPWDNAYPSTVVVGRQTQRNVYGPQGRLQCSSRADGSWDVFEWDGDGIAVVAHTAPDGVRATHQISGIGSPLSEPRGAVVRLLDRPGAFTDFTYDALGRVKRISQSGGAAVDIVSVEADSQGARRQLTARRSDGTTIKQRWNGFGQVVEHSELSETGEHAASYEYDHAGRLRKTTLPSPVGSGQVVTWTQTFDALGRVIRACGPLERCEAALHSPFVLTTRSSGGEQQKLRLNAFGGVAEAWSGTPLRQQGSASFDALGALSEMRDASGVTLSVERDLGAIVKVARAGAPDTVLDYTSDGKVASVAQGARVAKYVYDGIGRLQRVEQRESGKPMRATSYAYSPSGPDQGLLRNVRTVDVVESYGYDAHGRLTSIKQTMGDSSDRLELTYAYDAHGRLYRVRSGQAPGIDYLYKGSALVGAVRTNDPSRLLFQATEIHPIAGPRHIAAGPVTVDRRFDELGRLLGNGVSGRSVSYRYDPSGNLEAMKLGDVEFALEYDDVGRLTRMAGGGIDRRYRFNDVDSPTELAGTLLAYANPATPHAATGADTLQIRRDTQGRIVQWGRAEFRYDAGDDVPSHIGFPGTSNDLKITRGPSGELVKVTRGARTIYRALGGLKCRGSACALTVAPGPGVSVDLPLSGGNPWITTADSGGAATVSQRGSASPSVVLRDGYGVPLTSTAEVLAGDSVLGNAVVLNANPALSLVGDRVLFGELGSFLSPDDLVPSDLRQAPLNSYAFARNNGFRFTDVGGRYGYDTASVMGSGGMSFRLNFPLPAFSFSFDLDTGLQSDMDSWVLHGQWADLNKTLFRIYDRNQVGFLERGGTPASLAFPMGLSGQDASGVPRGASLGTGYIQQNAQSANASWLPAYAFGENVYPGNAWDYKSQTLGMIASPAEWLVAQNAGNFNYGAVGVAVGFSPSTLLQVAGAVQVAQSVRELRGQYLLGLLFGQYGKPFQTPPYGDDPVDQYWINRGIRYFQPSPNPK